MYMSINTVHLLLLQIFRDYFISKKTIEISKDQHCGSLPKEKKKKPTEKIKIVDNVKKKVIFIKYFISKGTRSRGNLE